MGNKGQNINQSKTKCLNLAHLEKFSSLLDTNSHDSIFKLPKVPSWEIYWSESPRKTKSCASVSESVVQQHCFVSFLFWFTFPCLLGLLNAQAQVFFSNSLPPPLTPCRSRRSRWEDLQRKSAHWPWLQCGCTACLIWLPRHQRPWEVGGGEEEEWRSPNRKQQFGKWGS